MVPVLFVNLDRPGLAVALADRGLIGKFCNEDMGTSGTAVTWVVGCAGGAARIDLVRCGSPVLMVIDGNEAAVIAALDAGADDAVTAQSSDALIAARVSALVRRHRSTRWWRIGDLCIDTLECRVTRAGQPIALLPREYRLLLELAQRPGEVVPRQALVAALCGLAFDPGTNVIEVHVSRLRAKIDRGFAVPMLHTERGRGYRLAVTANQPHKPIAAIAAAR